MVASNIPRLVIAAPHSHSGKTTVTLALLAALTERGLRVAPFVSGQTTSIRKCIARQRDELQSGHLSGPC